MKRKLAWEALYHSGDGDAHQSNLVSDGCMSLFAFDRTRAKIRQPEMRNKALALLKEIEKQRDTPRR